LGVGELYDARYPDIPKTELMQTGFTSIQFEIVVWEGKLRRAEDIRTLRQIMASMDMWVVIEVLMTIQVASHFFNVLWLFFSHQAGHFFADR
jgi:hypothetical protein